MMYSVVPRQLNERNPLEQEPAQVPTMTWNGVKVAVEDGCIRHVMSSNPFDYLNIGPCSRI